MCRSLQNRNKIHARPTNICLKSIGKLKTLKWLQINLYQYSNNFLSEETKEVNCGDDEETVTEMVVRKQHTCEKSKLNYLKK